MSLFEGNGMILNLYSEVENPKLFLQQVNIVLTSITLGGIGLGLLSYMTFGNNLSSLILYNLPPLDPLAIAIKLLYMFTIAGIYVLIILPVFQILEASAWYQDFTRFNETVKLII